jgi:CubicO group peptidase (beta-lactamase class C family)
MEMPPFLSISSVVLCLCGNACVPQMKISKMIADKIYFQSIVLTACILILSNSCVNVQQIQQNVSGWEISQETYDKQLIGSLKSKITENTYREINSIIVIKDGKLLIEEYFNGGGRNQVHDSRSVGKTFASALLGIALNEGYIRNLDQTLSDFYDLKKYKHYSDKKSGVRLRDLLTMSSGFDGNDNDASSIGNEENMYPQANWVEWTLNLPMAQNRSPGDEWSYFTAGVVLLGDIVNQKVPQGLDIYADSKLFKPMGITNYKWIYTPQNVPSTAGGIRLTPLDLAKFGQLYKNGGQWEGKQILPKTWVDESFQKHKETTFEGDWYGYLWWNKVYTVNAQSYQVFYCSGNGGNKIFVFTDVPIVVVVTASAYNTRYMHKQVDEMMTEYIMPAVLRK